MVETILSGSKPLAQIIRAEVVAALDGSTFVTDYDANLQVGFIVYQSGGEIKRHTHHRIERTIVGTSEVIIVQRGRCFLDVYNDGRELVATRELREGDIMIMAAGGHGFRMLEDTVLLEVKQGPYPGVDEKDRF